LLERRGDPLRARWVLAADVAMLREMPPDARTPFLAERAQQDWESLVRLRWETETTAEASAATRSAASRSADPQADPWDAAVECEAAYRLLLRNAEMVKQQRDAGHLKDARQTVDRMLISGRHMVARHPEQPAAYLALCEAHVQSCKLGWKLDDPAAIEPCWTQAVRAAQQARSLDPAMTAPGVSVPSWRRSSPTSSPRDTMAGPGPCPFLHTTRSNPPGGDRHFRKRVTAKVVSLSGPDGGQEKLASHLISEISRINRETPTSPRMYIAPIGSGTSTDEKQKDG
jgi:hypothetical protein